MPIAFRPSRPEDLEGIAALLQSAFNAPADAPFLRRDVLLWKYFERNPEWSAGPRSYVLAGEEKILAHGCAWPVSESVACLIDWASSRAVPGLGILMARKMGEVSPVLLSIGGSEMTRKIMPKIGFGKRGEVLSYARVLRPWRQARMRPTTGLLKGALRFGRNFVWSLGSTALLRGWSAVVAEEPRYSYMRRCPGARILSYTLNESGRVRGSLLLSQVRGQTRIADLQLDSASQQDRESAFAAAIVAGRSHYDACELMAVAQDGPGRAALLANGFQERARRSVFVSDPQRRLPGTGIPFRVNMLSDDMAYLDVPDSPYLT